MNIEDGAISAGDNEWTLTYHAFKTLAAIKENYWHKSKF